MFVARFFSEFEEKTLEVTISRYIQAGVSIFLFTKGLHIPFDAHSVPYPAESKRLKSGEILVIWEAGFFGVS